MHNTFELYHHGIKGQKWGVRRFQNLDRTWTDAGKIRYGDGKASNKVQVVKKPEKLHLIRDTITESKKIKSDFRTYLGNKTGHYNRNSLNTNLPKNDADAKKQGWTKLTDAQSAMHQNSKQDGVLNSKWVSPDGHKEVVFTGKGKKQHITSDVRDEGTYNYADPNKNPFGHTIHDVLPYIFLGNEANDPTTTVSRLYGSAANFLNMEVKMDPEKMSKGKKAVYNAIMVHSDIYSEELYHHGILGQKWGVRRYQNEDGSYTEEGKRRYANNQAGRANQYYDYYENAKKDVLKDYGDGTVQGFNKWYKETYVPYMKKNDRQKDIVESKHLVDRIVTNRLKEAYLNDYGGLNEFYRDRYAKMTHDAVRNNVIWASVGTAVAAGGTGGGFFVLTDPKQARIAYEKHDRLINSKNTPIGDYLNSYSKAGKSGKMQKLISSKPERTISLAGNSKEEIESKAKIARFVETDYAQLQNDWRSGIKLSGEIKKVSNNEKQRQKFLADGSTKIDIDAKHLYVTYENPKVVDGSMNIDYNLDYMVPEKVTWNPGKSSKK